MKNQKKLRLQSGFNLIELMVVVVIIGILAATILPSYREHVRRAHRADAKAVLLEDAQFLEKNFTEANRYDKNTAGNDVALPLTQSPRTGDASYSVVLTVSQTSYTLSAAPVADTVMDGDRCGSLIYNQLGQKKIAVGGTEITDNRATQCWDR
ncbi:type IV pilus assembly protein PilE [Novimethylophilus kurashikiensis]|uniref:Type IV pilus assembly protein PilE n=1 Tax=Novimethylophilus kurashikiensis TaxID=1825523 RepID=A0A2R5F6C7_9PROT|nr:type IV pilin protein [Novimethylophilus kurashikiensis]GBG12503.1 type IV pilus assembly protein PilE [Novimethylophilus kurashikiensis]